MRNVVLYELLSLDGVAERPIDFFPKVDDVLLENLRRVIADQDTVLLGRKTYDTWAQDWPDSDMEPFAPFINNVRKYVVTSSPLARPWQNSEVVDAPIGEFIAKLKQQEGGDIGVHGSLSLARTLLREGLVDELRLVIAPAIAGSGTRLLDGLPPRRFQLTRQVSNPDGYLFFDYLVPTTTES
jgi:dihydrofolate reductase